MSLLPTAFSHPHIIISSSSLKSFDRNSSFDLTLWLIIHEFYHPQGGTFECRVVSTKQKKIWLCFVRCNS
uniref:Uncharacterized protein n=1 Tax=Physcomitrium patens TaxID=3218 RepID=A0A2K1JEI1_PHYPA|nr:hypothetical protein PHYPA_020178 [Physcomitrium patens]